MEQYDPNGDHSTAKKATTESKNNIQKSPVFFLVVSILIIFCKYRAELFICCFLLVLIEYFQ